MKSSDALASFDHVSSCWRTSQASLLQTLDASSDVFSGPWPRSGTMRSGVCYPQPMSARLTDASGSGSWPTPNSSDYKGAMSVEACKTWEFRGTNLPEAAVTWATPAAHEGRLGFQDRSRGMQGSQESITTQAMCFTGDTPSASKAQTAPSDSSPAKPRRAGLNPRFGLWLMGYPAAWLDFVESETASSPRARLKSSAPLKRETL